MSVSPLHAALREATSDQHQAVETDAGVEGRLRDPARRPEMVAGLLALHEAVEAGLGPWASDLDRAGYAPPRRSELIRTGLADLGGDVLDPDQTKGPASLGEALGWLYVAEGSMLGGRVMRKGMIADGVDLAGLGFLDPYGDETGARWKTLIGIMDSECASGRAAQADILKGGRAAFDLAYRLLVPTHPDESFS